MNQEKRQQHTELLRSLFHELFQTEQSAHRHAMRECERLGATGPGDALRAISTHAVGVLRELPALARDEQLPVSRLGQLVGTMFSKARDLFADRLIDEERSYRGTLLGMRHGVDLVKLIRHVADASGRVEIGGFCTRWLETREPLVAAVEQQLSWFAHHPDVAAVKASKPLPLQRQRAS